MTLEEELERLMKHESFQFAPQQTTIPEPVLEELLLGRDGRGGLLVRQGAQHVRNHQAG